MLLLQYVAVVLDGKTTSTVPGTTYSILLWKADFSRLDERTEGGGEKM
jgi:hypothetical protein